MRKILYNLLVFLLFVTCSEDNPTPSSFLDYNDPYNEYIRGEILDQLNKEIKHGNYGDIHSLLIIRNDKIVFENYYSGYQRSDLHAIGASTQSVISTLIGIMLHENSSLSLKSKIINLLPGYSSHFENIPQKDQIEIGHLMSHTSGFWWDEWTKPFGNKANDAYVMTLSNDWISHALSAPMIREPGHEFSYNSGNAILMAPIIQQLSGINLEQYAKEKLFDPLDITEWKWDRISEDYVNAAWGLHLKPMDLAKIGYLYLKEGVWNDHRIFGENWKKKSSRNRTYVTNYFNYGYFWWRFSYFADVAQTIDQNDIFFSWGDGGQYLFIIPHLELLVVTTAGNNKDNETLAIEMLRDYIFPSVVEQFP